MWITAKRQKIFTNLMLMFGLNEVIDQLAMATVFIGMVMC